jgi:hypothetical protein
MMIRLIARRLVIGLLLLFALCFLAGFVTGTLLAAESCVSLKVRPGVMLTRQDIHVKARVARDADHRWLEITWDSDRGFPGSTRLQLDGADAPITFDRWYPNMPPGRYVIVARVIDALGHEHGTARADIRSTELLDP